MPTDQKPRLIKPEPAPAVAPVQTQMPPAPQGYKWTPTRSGDRNVLKGSKLEREVLEDIKAQSHLVNFITTGGEIWGTPREWDRYTIRVLKEDGLEVLVYKGSLLAIEGILPAQEKIIQPPSK